MISLNTIAAVTCYFKYYTALNRDFLFLVHRCEHESATDRTDKDKGKVVPHRGKW
jgi:hypothetical protein